MSGWWLVLSHALAMAVGALLVVVLRPAPEKLPSKAAIAAQREADRKKTVAQILKERPRR
jgi:hypothetical protein